MKKLTMNITKKKERKWSKITPLFPKNETKKYLPEGKNGF